MADEALQRTVRRCVAVVVIPLSLLVLQVRRFATYEQRLDPALTLLIPGALLVGAVGYFVLSLLQIDRPASADRQSGDREAGDGEADDGATETA